MTVAIIGAGMAGFGAAHRLRCEGMPSVIYDKNPYYGGHTTSHVFEGRFVFDDGPHISFTKNERIQKLLSENVRGEYETIQARVNNYWKGLWIKHPAQCNLFGLPPTLVTDIVCDMMNARHQPHDEVRTYADWLVQSYGRTFAETFPMEYGMKYHTTAAANMSTDWLGPRLYVPELREVVAGALAPTTHDVHYVNHFRYPTRGGFVAYLHPLAREASLSLGREVSEVDPNNGTLTFADGSAAQYHGSDLVDAAAGACASNQGRAARGRRCEPPPRVHLLRAGQPRGRPRGPFGRALDLFLRRRHLLYAAGVPPYAIAAQRARRDGIDS